MKIIGVGLGRTGTTSIQRALNQLGYNAYNMEAVIKHQHFADWLALFKGETSNPDWSTLFAGYNATIAWPPCFFYKELMVAYPEARFILTLRDPESWADSFMRNWQILAGLRPFRFIPRVKGILAFLNEGLLPYAFGGEPTRERAIAAFQKHNAAIQQAIPPEKLLVYEVKQGWEPLCTFLNTPIPDTSFPYENKSADFKEMAYKLLGIKH